MGDDHSDDLLRRALLDAEASAAVALRVHGVPLCETLTVVFHGRRDLGTIQTYVVPGRRGPGDAVGADELMRGPGGGGRGAGAGAVERVRVPCALGRGAGKAREEPERLYAEQAAALRDALI